MLFTPERFATSTIRKNLKVKIHKFFEDSTITRPDSDSEESLGGAGEKPVGQIKYFVSNLLSKYLPLKNVAIYVAEYADFLLLCNE